MVSIIKEALIIKEYTDVEEHIQLFVDIPASTTVTATYTPPVDYTFFIIYLVTGPHPYGKIKATLTIDGTIHYDEIISSSVLEHVLPIIPLNFVKSKLEYTLINLDVVSHTLDTAGVGFLVPNAKMDELIEEITGRKDRRVMEEIRDELKEISRQLRRRPARR